MFCFLPLHYTILGGSDFNPDIIYLFANKAGERGVSIVPTVPSGGITMLHLCEPDIS